MNKYRYTMLLSPIQSSKLLSYIEGTEAKLIMKVEIEVESEMSEKDKKADLDSKIGTETPDGLWEFVRYENLMKFI